MSSNPGVGTFLHPPPPPPLFSAPPFLVFFLGLKTESGGWGRCGRGRVKRKKKRKERLDCHSPFSSLSNNENASWWSLL